MLMVLVMAVVMSCKITSPIQIRRVRVYLVAATDPLADRVLFWRSRVVCFCTGKHVMLPSLMGGGVQCIEYLGVPVEYPIGLVILLACAGAALLARTQNQRGRGA